MVKLKGPLLSSTAAGALSGTLIFSSSKGRRYLKKFHKPKNPKTPAQIGMRAITAFCSTIWKSLPAADTDSWQTLADQANVSPLNACLAYNLRRWRDGQYPATRWPAGTTATPVFAAIWTAVPVTRGILHTMATINLADGRGWPLFRSSVDPTPTTWNKLAYIMPCLPFGDPLTWFDRLQPGTYWYRRRQLAYDGNFSATRVLGPIVVT